MQYVHITVYMKTPDTAHVYYIEMLKYTGVVANRNMRMCYVRT